LIESLQENLAGLPVAQLEILHHSLKLATDLAIAEREHCVDQPLSSPGIGSIALPGKVEGTNDDA
jgi:hypothetical protein